MSALPTFKPKCCGRVLTSADNIALMEEREKLKVDQEKAKEERRRIREEKRAKACKLTTVAGVYASAKGMHTPLLNF